jgi:adenylosuccinate lyase
MTAAEQWFERTLDDSANKRLSIPEAFLAADACLILANNICDGLVVYPAVIERHVNEELPFMATENILMESVKKGGDRQSLHEHIRRYSMDARKSLKMEGGKNDLIERIASDKDFRLSRDDLKRIFNPSDFVGLAPVQTTEFLEQTINPLLKKAEKYGTDVRHEIKV